jgi:hypothetical protein
MIGFRPLNTTRRPVYSLTGEKLCYVVAGPEGEQFIGLDGRKLATITKWKKVWREMSATQCMAGTVTITPTEE